jgi:hypothetical protein
MRKPAVSLFHHGVAARTAPFDCDVELAVIENEVHARARRNSRLLGLPPC